MAIKNVKKIKIIIDNPECILIAQEKLVKFICDQYISETKDEVNKKIAQ